MPNSRSESSLGASKTLLRATRIKGALLYGPPGTGKTHLARTLAKVSASSMLVIDGATILSKWVGDSEKGVKAAFTLARKLFPCVLFIDEVDSLFGRRESIQRSGERSIVNQFLQQMDGLATHDESPFILVTTNRPGDLDEAYLRRLPQKILIGMPDVSARSQILRVLLKGENLDAEVDIETLAKRTIWYTGSDLRSVCEEAVLLWMIEESKASRSDAAAVASSLCNAHFERALEKIKPTVSELTLRQMTPFAEKNGGDTRRLILKAKYSESIPNSVCMRHIARDLHVVLPQSTGILLPAKS